MATDKNIQNNRERSEDMIQSDLSGNAFLQTPDEYQKDKGRSPQDDTISVSRTADRESDADKYAGSDRAGTAERKSQEMPTDDNE